MERLLRSDRTLVLVALFAVVALAAAYTIAGAGMDMSALTMTRMAIEMPGMMMQPAQWSVQYAIVTFLMWWMMMIAMMVPSATPAILVFAGIAGKQAGRHAPLLKVSSFMGGYLLAWGAFSLVATAMQWGLEKAGLVTGMMEIGSPVLAGSVLIGAGLYQLTPVKLACLRHCQQPVIFLMQHWRPGRAGALRMGLRHGAHCLGCCWLLMALLFVGGVMNLLWIAGLAIYVAVEKLAGNQRLAPKIAAAALTISGIWLVASGLGAV
jgi:predicted metal-binding membrane protein